MLMYIEQILNEEQIYVQDLPEDLDTNEPILPNLILKK